MKIRIIYILLCVLMAIPLSAQRRKKKEEPPKPSVEECISKYDFTLAIEVLEEQISELKKKKQPTEELETKLEWVRRGRNMVKGTEKVLFIDSIVVNKKEFLNTIKISSECGQIETFTKFFGRPDTTNSTIYLSELGNKIYYAYPNSEGLLRLYSSDLIGDSWNSPTELKGLEESDINRNYPFMLSDGFTLYYAAQGEESLGGYDIFVSRYDYDTQSFLYPENIGMPFNSPANDYMFAIDEHHKIGWFATDRNQPNGKVCVYTFIPNEVKEIYSTEGNDFSHVQRLAMLHRIADTQTDLDALKAARIRLSEARTTQQEKITPKEFEFVINDKWTYSLTSDFKSEEAKKMVKWWKESSLDLSIMKKQIEQLRETYRNADKATRESLSKQILTLEKKQEDLTKEIHEQTKKIRKAEISFIMQGTK
ncbi:MAG: hypothetical protein II222_04075 [Paraprevotella sp.]|nr:hypothetical protein [Paraprevotella sp.]